MTALNFYAFARHALVDALRMSGVKPGDSVLLPDFICRDVFASLTAVGATPLLYKMQPNLQPFPDQRFPNTKAVIVVNYFGFPADLSTASSLGVNESTVVIEDNAHGFLSRDELGRPLGFRTEIGITSFRKTIRSPDGAFLSWSESPLLDETQVRFVGTRDRSVPPSYRLRAMVQHFQQRTGVKALDASQWLAHRVRRARRRSPTLDDSIQEFELPAEIAPYTVSVEMFHAVNAEREVTRRRILFQNVNELAESLGVTRVFPALPSGASPQGFPYFSDSGPSLIFEREIQERRMGSVSRWPSLATRSQISQDSPLRKIKIVNFLQ